jgi:zinc protease
VTFRRNLYISAVLASLLTAASLVSAQTTPAGREITAASVASYKLTDLMPVDPDATVGTLPNGLRYYVRANGRPARRAELRLVVKAGSVLEDDDQKGLAHFVEHMLFEGTQHFPGASLVGFLSSLGLSIGPDANAVTRY